jgi:hypothetical protein
VFPRGDGGETRNTKTDAVPVKIGGENIAGVAPELFSTLSDINTINTAIKEGAIHLWTMGLWQ